MRVVLYAEGAGDAAGTATLPPETGAPLGEDQFSPAHFLVRRAIAQQRSAPIAAITFEGPLLHRARTARGGDLAQPKIVRQLLTWP